MYSCLDSHQVNQSFPDPGGNIMANDLQQLSFGLLQPQTHGFEQLQRQLRMRCQQRFEILLVNFT
jgi:hypothetical protein